jgi:hypothetical protein
MRSVILGSLGAILASAGVAFAQPSLLPATHEGHASPNVWSQLSETSCGPSCDHGRFWASAEYMLWWVKKQPNSFPLVTSDITGTAGTATTEGGFFDPTTVVLIGDRRYDVGALHGFRLTVGADIGKGLALEVNGFWLPEQSVRQEVQSDGTGFPFIFRPIINTDTGNVNAGLYVSQPGNFAGLAFVENTTELWGFEANLFACLGEAHGCKWDLIAGIRYLELEESLNVGESSTLIPPFGGPINGGLAFNGITLLNLGDRVDSYDLFRTKNQICGGTVGLRGTTTSGCWTFAIQTKLTLGNNHQTIDIGGQTTAYPIGGQPQTVDGGLLAVASNSGRFTNDQFVIMPELNLRVQYDFSDRCYAYLGYDLLYINKVIRPAETMSPFVNDTQSPLSFFFNTPPTGPIAPPPPSFRTSDFWGQGFNFGVGFKF